VSYFVEFEEVYFLCTVWDFFGPCGLQAGITSGSGQHCSDSRFRTTYISHTPKGNFGSHKNILHEVYQRICTDHNTYGKVVEEGTKVPMEQGLLEGFGHLKEKNSDRVDFDLSRLE
jgi:hypothetical protein